MRRLSFIVCCAFYLCSLCAWSAEVRRLTQEDLQTGPANETFTSPGLHTGHKIPRYWDNNAFTDNLTLYGKGVTGDNTGRLQNMSIGAAGRTDNVAGNYGVFNYVFDNQIINVKDPRYGAKGDNTTIDITAINNAVADASANGGGIVFLPKGWYKTNNYINHKSNVWIVGAGPGATFINNVASTWPEDEGIYAKGSLGANYAINSPSIGSNTVTCTTASEAGNFSVGDNVAVTGNLQSGAYYPFFATTVVSADNQTGVVTLDERLRRVDLTKIHKISSLISNIGIANLTIHAGLDVGFIAEYARNVHISNVRFGSGLGVAATNFIASRDVFVRDSIFEKNLGSHSTVDSQYIGNVFRKAWLPLEGGCQDISIVSNNIYDPPSSGIKVDTKSQRITIIGNSIYNVPNLYCGVKVSGANAGWGGTTISANTITGGSLGDYGICIGDNSIGNIVFGNTINQCDFGIGESSDSSSNNIFNNTITGTLIRDYDRTAVTGTYLPLVLFGTTYPTSGGYHAGDVMINTAPANDNSISETSVPFWYCITSGTSGGTWRAAYKPVKATPASKTASGAQGMMAYDNTYWYWADGLNSWKRAVYDNTW